jgi:hypothetical protein
LGNGPSAFHPARYPQRERGSAGVDGDTRAHNTLSAETTAVHVYYPFHPLRGATLQVIRRPKRDDGAVSVLDQSGKRLKIPVWMLSPECGEIRFSQEPNLSRESLLSLASLISSLHNPECDVHGNLLQTVVTGCEGGCRDAATVSGHAACEGERSRATGKNGAGRTDRSHGARPGRSLSQGGRK